MEASTAGGVALRIPATHPRPAERRSVDIGDEACGAALARPRGRRGARRSSFRPTLAPSVDPKPPSASRVTSVELVLPNDTNTLGNLMGGRLLHLMDIAAAIAAQRHSGRTVVTASVDSVDFKSPIRLGEVVALTATVNRAFTSSMEVQVEAFAENNRTGERRHGNSAYFTFVAVDTDGRPIPVAPVAPETDDERARYDGAAHRREQRLVLSGRLALADAAALLHHLGAPAPRS